MLTGKKVAILIGPKFHDEEVAQPRDYLLENGAIVDLVGIDKEKEVGKNGRIKLAADVTFNQVEAGDYDGLIIPGGGAPERLRVHEPALAFVNDFWQTGRPIGTICHGPQVLISANVLKGIVITSVVGIRDDVILAGATYVNMPVCIDGQLISSRRPEDLPMFIDAFSHALQYGFAEDEDAGLDPLHALLIATSREKGAHDFYNRVADKVASKSIANKFKYLALIENDHFEQLSDLYAKLTGKPPEIDSAATEIGKVDIAADINGEQALELAMGAEQKAYDFYRNAALKAKSQRAKEMFEYLAAEELEHKRLLSIDRAADLSGEGHFQWATYWDVPPGMEDLW